MKVTWVLRPCLELMATDPRAFATPCLGVLLTSLPESRDNAAAGSAVTMATRQLA